MPGSPRPDRRSRRRSGPRPWRCVRTPSSWAWTCLNRGCSKTTAIPGRVWSGRRWSGCATWSARSRWTCCWSTRRIGWRATSTSTAGWRSWSRSTISSSASDVMTRSPTTRQRWLSSWRTHTRVAASASCCSSTSPRPPASATSGGSSQRSCRPTTGCCRSSARWAIRSRARSRRGCSGWRSGSSPPTPPSASCGPASSGPRRRRSSASSPPAASPSSVPAAGRTPSARRWCATSCSATTRAASTR